MTCRNDFEFGVQLGRGSFGVVFQVRRKEDGVTCVCKQIALNEMKRKGRLEAHREVELLRNVSSGSSFIVQYLGSFLEEDSLHIIMEFCEKGDLSQFLKTCHRGLEEKTVWRYLLQISSGLLWLHQNRILHRDIKTLNVFLKTNDDVRLGDLGVARVLSNTNFANTFVGTPYYLSPEICEEKPYNELSDVWAFGCVVYEMCTLRHPFEAKNQAALLIKILRGQFAPIDTKYSEDLRELIDGCMQRELVKRSKLTELLTKPVARSWASRLEIPLQDVKAPTRKAEKRPVATGRATPHIPKQQAPRTRVRLDPRANARREESKTILVAPKAKTERTSVTKGDQKMTGDEERLKAEVAELPDVVMAAARPSRNVPSVQQLLSMDNSPIKRLLQRNGGSMTQAALQEPEVEVTLRPDARSFHNEELAEEIDEELEGVENDAELTQRSAFEDSLMYTDSINGETFGGQTLLLDFANEEVPAEEEEEAMTTKIDGLLCDTWVHTLNLEDVLQEQIQPLDDAETIPEELTVIPGVETKVDAVPTVTAAVTDPAAQVERLSAQISRLYVEVVRDLDAPARKVWDELYALFQEKMRIDMTDEDQSEIETFIFEHLPTESTELIWKVYKVLYLEQERDRYTKSMSVCKIKYTLKSLCFSVILHF
eukprot:symbB.v1.2.006977.t1/scaffold424.1/size207036/5